MFYISGTDFKEFQKCMLCPKTFVNESFLVAHLNRRHQSEMNGNKLTGTVLGEYIKNNTFHRHDHEDNIGGEEIKLILQEMMKHLKTNKSDEGGNISHIVTAQQAQINELQSMIKTQLTLEHNPALVSEAEGKLKAQELFWQSKLKSLEDNFSKSQKDSDHKLQKIQEEFEIEVTKIKKQRRRDKRKQRRNLQTGGIDSVNIQALVKNIEKTKKEELTEVIESQTINVSEAAKKNGTNEELKEKEMPKEILKENMKESLSKDHDDNKQFDEPDRIHLDIESEIESIEDNIIEQEIVKSKTKPKEFCIKKTVSSTSIKSDHVYEAPLSFCASKENLLEMMEKNPTKIEEIKQQCKVDLADRLEEMGVDPNSIKIKKRQMESGIKELKHNRKKLSNSADIEKLRVQCEKEVDSLVNQGMMKHGSIKKRLSKGMSSFRKQIFRSLQNLRVEEPKSKLSSPDTKNIRKRKSPKKKSAPQPPKMPEKQSLNKATENEYVENPVKLPPKPAPRQSKAVALPQESDSDESENESVSSEDEEEDEFEVHGRKIVSEQDEEDIIGMFVDRERDVIGMLVDKENEEKQVTKLNLIEEPNDPIPNTDEDCDNISEEEVEDEEEDLQAVSDDVNDEKEDITEVDDENDSVWDSEEENCNDIVNADVHTEPEEIKLRKPQPGSKIADLTNIIEQQLHRRTTLKPAGGVDPLLAAMEQIDENLKHDEEVPHGYPSMTDLSSNTLGTSQWQENGSYHSRPGSAATMGSGYTGYSSRPQSGHREHLGGSRPQSAHRDAAHKMNKSCDVPIAPPRNRKTSWDSD